MHIAITGGSGRVGSAVIELALAEGHSVISIDRVLPQETAAERPQLTHILADTTDYHAFENALRDCDALIHLAAIASPDRHPAHMVHNNNVVASYNALCAAEAVGITRVCQASSINAIGGFYSRRPRYDYLPLDEQHPTYNEDPYSLSKWVMEQQGDSFARRYEHLTIASLRLHGVTDKRASTAAWPPEYLEGAARHLWGYTKKDAAARACLQALTADFKGHEAFYIVAPTTMMPIPSMELKERFFPDVPLRRELVGDEGFFDCRKAEQMLGWRHGE